MTIQKFILGSNSLQGLLFAFSPSSRCHPIDIYSKVNRKKTFTLFRQWSKEPILPGLTALGKSHQKCPLRNFRLVKNERHHPDFSPLARHLADAVLSKI